MTCRGSCMAMQLRMDMPCRVKRFRFPSIPWTCRSSNHSKGPLAARAPPVVLERAVSSKIESRSHACLGIVGWLQKMKLDVMRWQLAAVTCRRGLQPLPPNIDHLGPAHPPTTNQLSLETNIVRNTRPLTTSTTKDQHQNPSEMYSRLEHNWAKMYTRLILHTAAAIA